MMNEEQGVVALWFEFEVDRVQVLNRDSAAEGLRDGSGKPGEGFVAGLVPDLERTAQTDDKGQMTDESPKGLTIVD